MLSLELQTQEEWVKALNLDSIVRERFLLQATKLENLQHNIKPGNEIKYTVTETEVTFSNCSINHIMGFEFGGYQGASNSMSIPIDMARLAGLNVEPGSHLIEHRPLLNVKVGDYLVTKSQVADGYPPLLGYIFNPQSNDLFDAKVLGIHKDGVLADLKDYCNEWGEWEKILPEGIVSEEELLNVQCIYGVVINRQWEILKICEFTPVLYVAMEPGDVLPQSQHVKLTPLQKIRLHKMLKRSNCWLCRNTVPEHGEGIIVERVFEDGSPFIDTNDEPVQCFLNRKGQTLITHLPNIEKIELLKD